MAAGKTFESKLGKQYYPVVLEHRRTLALLNSYMIQKYNQPAIDEKTKKFSYSKEQWVEFFQMYKKLIDSHVMPDTKYYASFGKSNMYEMKPWIQGEWAGTYMWNSTINKYSDNLKPPAKLELGTTRCCRAPPMPACSLNRRRCSRLVNRPKTGSGGESD
jgi:oligogalacturonide transport system substrate-binding protein